ncbi:MAG: sulfotransferase family protein [Actinomadura sp.]
MLKIIGAGFGRTGTASTKAALETIGFGPCYHMMELFTDPSRLPGWLRATAGEPVDWAELFAGYAATVDWPGAAFWRELIEAYPEAGVLLTVRDQDRWYDSVAGTIYLARDIDESAAPPGLREQLRMVDELVWQGTFGGRFEDRDHAIGVYRAHLAEVRATVPAERLLEYDVAQGWEPLCAFLGVDVPDEPFPHLNTAQSMREGIEAMRRGSTDLPDGLTR